MIRRALIKRLVKKKTVKNSEYTKRQIRNVEECCDAWIKVPLYVRLSLFIGTGTTMLIAGDGIRNLNVKRVFVTAPVFGVIVVGLWPVVFLAYAIDDFDDLTHPPYGRE